MLALHVCVGSSCYLKGAYNIIQTFQHLMEENGLHGKLETKSQYCMKNCRQGVSVSLGGEVFSVTPETSKDFFRDTVLPRLE